MQLVLIDLALDAMPSGREVCPAPFERDGFPGKGPPGCAVPEPAQFAAVLCVLVGLCVARVFERRLRR